MERNVDPGAMIELLDQPIMETLLALNAEVHKTINPLH